MDWSVRLCDVSRSGDGDEASDILRRLQGRLEEDLTTAEIDELISDLFYEGRDANRSPTLLSFIRENFTDSSFADSVSRAFTFIETVLDSAFGTKLDKYLEKIVAICLAVLRSACVAKVKEKSLLPLRCIISNRDGKHVPEILDVLTKHVSIQMEKPTVLSKEYQLIGIICKNYPELVDEKAEIFRKCFLHTLEEHVGGKAKISFPLLEGCFAGLNGFLVNFHEAHMSDIVYKGVKMFSDPGEQSKRGHARASLSIITNHCSKFSRLLYKDYKYWHVLLLKWINQSYAEDKKVGHSALFSYYNCIGDHLSNEDTNGDSANCIEYFMQYFKNILSEILNHDADVTLISSTYEVKYALKGFTTLISKCRRIFKPEEYENISKLLTQRAFLLYKSKNDFEISTNATATEESTSTIEELCTHIEAIVAIGTNVDHNVESLICILITDYPKCKPHRRFIVKSAILQSLKIVNLQIIVNHFVKETCKHCVLKSSCDAVELENDSLLTIASYVPLWRDILDIKTSPQLSNEIFDEFMPCVIKLIPCFDLSTKQFSLPSNNSFETEEFNDLENFELPTNLNDYRYFTNLCDLTVTIISFRWTHEWLFKWIDMLLVLIINGRKTYPKVVGYLIMAEAVFKAIKYLNSTCETVDFTLSENIKNNILELINGLSFYNNDFFELKAALMYLQAPSILLNNILLIEKAIAAFKILFKFGKNNISIIATALEILEDGIVNIRNENFKLLCKEILPFLNEYLCSSGVFHGNVKFNSMILLSKYKNNSALSLSNELVNSQLSEIQRRIVLFLGKVDSASIHTLLATNQSNDQNEIEKLSIYIEEKLKLSIPYNQQKIDLYLDLLFPRIKHLALNSMNRETRITACQALHSLIILFFGTNKTIPYSQKRSLSGLQVEMYSALIVLAADTDEFVANIFSPLLKQTSHWYALPENNQSREAEIFVSCLLNGVSQSSDNFVQEMSCQVMNEYLIWIVKKSSVEQLKTVPSSVSVLLSSVCQMMNRPNENDILASYLIINGIHLNLCHCPVAVDEHLLEMIYSVIKSIEKQTDINSCFLHKTNTVINTGLQCLDNAFKCLKQKINLFKNANTSRKFPEEMGEGKLVDVARWILTQAKNKNRDVAKKCIEMYLYLYDSFKQDGLMEMTESLPCLTNFENINAYLTTNHTASYSEVNSDINSYINHILNLYNTFDNCVTLFEHVDWNIEDLFLCENYKNLTFISEMQSFFNNANKLKMEQIRETINRSQISVDLELFFNILCCISLKCFQMVSLFISKKYFGQFVDEISDHLLKYCICWMSDMRTAMVLQKYPILDQEIDKKGLMELFLTNWPTKKEMFENFVVEHLISHPIIKLFNEIDLDELHSYKNILFSLKNIEVLVNSMSKEKRHSVTNTFHFKIILKNIMEKIFIAQDSGYIIAPIDSSSLQVIENILKIIFKMENDSSEYVISILLDESLVNDYYFDGKSHTRGDYLWKCFERTIADYLLMNHDLLFNYTIEKINERNQIKLMFLLDRVTINLKSTFQSEDKYDSVCALWSDFFKVLWKKITMCNIPVDILIHTFSLLITNLSFPQKYIGSNENPLSLWLLGALNNCNCLSDKSDIIILLPCVLKPGIGEFWYNNYVLDALAKLKNCLPLSCHEFSFHTKKHSDYVTLLKGLLESLSNSGSYMILEFIIKLTVVDDVHICEDEIQLHLKSFIERLNSDDQITVVKEVYKYLSDNALGPDLILNLIKRFLIPMLSHCLPSVVEDFMASEISSILAMLDKKIAINMNYNIFDRIFVGWVAAFRMLEIMFLKVEFENIDSANSKIALEYYKATPIPQQFVKEIFMKAFQMRKIELPLSMVSQNSAEYLRLSHCAAYKLSFAITISRPKSDLKFYTILLNHKSGSSPKLWEGMIDSNKKYDFPIEVSKVQKTRHHVVPTRGNRANKNSMFNMSTLNSMGSLHFFGVTKNEENRSLNYSDRSQLISQTIHDNILKFDLNAAAIRNTEKTNTIPFENNAQTPLSLMDDDLNNHECMATVCQIIKDITSFDDDQSSRVSGSTVPDWIKCMAEVLIDRNRDKNVRLFIAQVIDNSREVLKKYAKSVFIPILTVVQDRCTEMNKGINHLDFCFISLLLSWRDVIIPETHDEVMLSSVILEFIAREINSTSQSSYTYKQCLELLNSVLEIWGSKLIIPYDFLSHKLENSDHKGTIQTLAAFLVNDLQPWNDTTYDKIKKFVLTSLKLNDKNIYNVAAEVIGLMLKRSKLSISTDEQNATDQERLASLIEDARKTCESIFAEKKYDKFISCVYNIQKHFNEITNGSILSKTTHIFPKFPVQYKKYCLNVIFNSLDFSDRDDITRELILIRIDTLLKNKDLRVLALHIFNKALLLKLSKIDSILKDIPLLCDLRNNNNRECRTVLFEILIKLYLYNKENSMEYEATDLNRVDLTFGKRPFDETNSYQVDVSNSKYNPELTMIKLTLLHGLDDEDPIIRDNVNQFWISQFSSQNIHDRWNDVCSEFFHNGCLGDVKLLSRMAKIVLNECNKDEKFSALKLFENPLEECSFVEYEWDRKDSNETYINKPLFSDTLNSHLLVQNIMRQKMQGKVPKQKDVQTLNTIIATQQKTFVKPENSFIINSIGTFNDNFVKPFSGKIFKIGTNTGTKHNYLQSRNEFTMSDVSSLGFSTQKNVFDFKTYQIKRSKSEPSENETIDKLRKRFVVDKKHEIIKFSGIYAEKKKQAFVKQIPKNKIESFRSFKAGDYPDIQIFIKDVYFPLMETVARDSLLAKDFFIVLFKSLSQCKEDENVNFNSFTINCVLQFLNSHKNSTVEAPFVLTLLELCRSALQNYCDLNDFDHVIQTSAKLYGMEWLGTLILEENKMLNDSSGQHISKRPKIDNTLNSNKLSNLYLDEIHRLKILGNYTLIQKVYSDAIMDESIDEDLRLNLTQGFFKSYYEMSDWDGLIDQLKFQFCKDDEPESYKIFDYDKLWRKSWIRMSILPLTFIANVQRLSQMNEYTEEKEVVFNDLENFNSGVNNWMANTEKKAFLNNHLLPHLSIWKSMFEINDNSLSLVNAAIEWIRNKWSYEYINSKYYLDNNEIHSTMNFIQILGEICNALQMPFFSGTLSRHSASSIHKYLEEMIETWNKCVPTTADSTSMWHLRLACRSIISLHTKNVVRDNMINCDSENRNIDALFDIMNKSKKANELSFIKLATEKNLFIVAEKLIKNQYQNLDSEEEIAWSLQWAVINKLKALRSIEKNTKLNSLMKSWKLSEDIRLSYVENLDCKLNVSFLTNVANISHEVYKILSGWNINFDNFFKEALIENFTIGQIFKENVSEFVTDPNRVNVALIKYSEMYLEESINLIENDLRKDPPPFNTDDNLISNSYFTMAKFCRSVITDKAISDMGNITKNFVTSILRAIKFGNIEARKIFPVLLINLESLKEGCEKESLFALFKKETSDISSWIFLPWISQLLAHLPVLKEILLELILKIATDYPQSVVHQYRLSRKMWKNNPELNDLIEQLDEKLIDEQIETFVQALNYVCDPYILLKTHLENIFKTAQTNDKMWNDGFARLFDDVFPDRCSNVKSNLRGSMFKKVLSYEATLNEIWKENISDVNKGLRAIFKFLKESTLEQMGLNKKYRSIKEYSPYLYNFIKRDNHPILLFGQYAENNFSKPESSKEVSIVKFESEIMIINSLRRPLRITVIGSNGKKYPLLIKRGEDLRQDERIQQLFALMNDHLSRENMKINNYRITPLSCDLGVIGWLNNHATLQEITLKYDSQTASLLESIKKKEVLNYLSEVDGNKLGEKYGNLAANPQQAENFYGKILEKVPQNLLRNCISKLAISPDNFVYMRNNLIKSIAPMNIAHWILGIGDRHMGNSLISLSSGNITGIDFGYAFGTATQILDVPELVPFRLTPQILKVLTPRGAEGEFRQLMIRSLESFRENSDLLLATMEVFVFEPTMDWTLHVAERKDKLAGDNVANQNENISQWSPRSKIDQCKRKLNGTPPVLITIEDLEMQTSNRENIEKFCVVMRKFGREDIQDQKILTTTEQVDRLISQATNPTLLALMYYGWESWL